MKRVLVSTATKSGVKAYWMEGAMSVTLHPIPGHEVTFSIEDTHQAINLSRNVMAHEALSKGYDIHVMIDADHPWGGADLERILSHQEPIVSALYCKKAPGDPVWVGLKAKTNEKREDGLVEAAYIPTGFLKVDVSVYKTLQERFPDRKYVYTDDNGKDFECFEWFPIGLVGPNTPEARLAGIRKLCKDVEYIDSAFALEVLDGTRPEPNRLLGEDYFFSHLCRKTGYKLWIDTQLLVYHMGQAPYPIPEHFLPKNPKDLPYARADLSAW